MIYNKNIKKGVINSMNKTAVILSFALMLGIVDQSSIKGHFVEELFLK